MRVSVLLEDLKAHWALRRTFGVRSAPPDGVRLRFVPSWAQLREDVTSGLCDLIILQPSVGISAPTPAINLPELELLASNWGREGVVLFLCRPNLGPSLFNDLRRMGFPILLIQGVDDEPGTILRTLARARCRRVMGQRLLRLGQPPPGESIQLLLDTLVGWPPATSVEELARGVKMSRRSLHRSMQARGFPSPGKAVSIARFLEACALWRMGITSRARIASILGLLDSSSLGHLSRTLADRPLSDFPDPDAGQDSIDWVIRKIGA